MTERERFDAWFQQTVSTDFKPHESGRMQTWRGWQACAEGKDKEIEWLKECVTVSNNDTKYYRGRFEAALAEVEALHDRLALIIGKREDLR